ncbi:unnamed protein product [Cyprideis torosa]|uniref:Uncharacterized protein n=1 Tax=Cyprideis torosa TaxID=163714 RepID=A0A7R8WMC0_9CRUS|nr:unnamed protein product [Cyprideis torosa]CAG0899188.1 unnamed protein product [Cyprideis torosa]
MERNTFTNFSFIDFFITGEDFVPAEQAEEVVGYMAKNPTSWRPNEHQSRAKSAKTWSKVGCGRDFLFDPSWFALEVFIPQLPVAFQLSICNNHHRLGSYARCARKNQGLNIVSLLLVFHQGRGFMEMFIGGVCLPTIPGTRSQRLLNVRQHGALYQYCYPDREGYLYATYAQDHVIQDLILLIEIEGKVYP